VGEEDLINPFTIDISTPAALVNKESQAADLPPVPISNDETLVNVAVGPAVKLTTRTRIPVRREEDGGSVHRIFREPSAESLPPDYEDLVERRLL